MIRKANVKDIPSIVKLWDEFMKVHDSIVLKNNKKLRMYTPKKKNAMKLYKKYISKEFRKQAIFVAEIDSEIVGYTLLKISDEIPIFRLEKIGQICDLYVKEKYRGMRISSQLKDSAIKWFKKKGIKHMSVQAYADNPFARSVYKRWGFFDYKIEMRKKL